MIERGGLWELVTVIAVAELAQELTEHRGDGARAWLDERLRHGLDPVGGNPHRPGSFNASTGRSAVRNAIPVQARGPKVVGTSPNWQSSSNTDLYRHVGRSAYDERTAPGRQGGGAYVASRHDYGGRGVKAERGQ